jgi:hypothetical protein
MSFGAAAFRTALFCLSALISACAHAEEIDTEHLYAFTIGTDVGNLGEREFQTQTTGRFSKTAGNYRAIDEEVELEFVPLNNFRIEVGSSLASYNINGVPGLDDRNQLGWQGISLDLRYKLYDRKTAPFGLTFAFETRARQIDDMSGAPSRNYSTELTMAIERELIPDRVVAAFNLFYEPESTHIFGKAFADQESTGGMAFAVMAQIRPGFLIGGEARYLRKYEGAMFDGFAGQALFVGPTAYWQLSERSRLTLAWSPQLWGRPTGLPATLDLVNFEREQARLIFGFNF